MTEVAVASEPARRTPRGFSAITPPRQLGLLLVALLGLQGCASLPDAQRDRAIPHSDQVKFEGTRGPVSNATSDAIIDKIEGRHGQSDLLDKHLAYEQAVNANSPLVLGNKLSLLQNGPDTYKAMFAAIREAKDHINLETFIFDDGEAGRQFSDLLLERQAAGVQVNVIYDSVGSLLTPASFFQHLKDGGIRVLEFNPVNPLAGNRKEWALNNRDHRKLMVIDGRIAFTGGINLSDTYSSSPSGRRPKKTADSTMAKTGGWRDTHIEIEGPAVAEFQKLFLDSWNKQKGEELAARNYFPELKPQGAGIVRAIGSTPDDPQRLIYLTLLSAITHAEHSVHLTIAYFAPDPQLLQALTDAVARGVDVSLVLPSYSDSWAIFHLGRSYYTKLLRRGVKLFERRDAVMHAKTVCIDGVWSTIGSTNLDWRSFLHNDEINAVVLGRDFGTQMNAMFDADISASQAIDLEHWRHRSWALRLKEQTARIAAYWL
ncbi:cardiolipin synthase [Sinimarinibacterium sp. CAU 1509]|uniref:cardiolipin synthase n=1 Tax=Sinimarinibacterium sp. CAU 1509 TaxID=2562283 RepID=UPI001B7F8E05|nr:cardiolipin synthase [Sinimarinibacterium sp. CAU 1509]